jgi:DMSO/TMAO reductase YedYZ heme-binding membrane subunit
VVHYLWLAKVGVRGPYYYVAWLALLFVVRVADAVRRARARARRPAAEGGLTPRPARPA